MWVRCRGPRLATSPTPAQAAPRSVDGRSEHHLVSVSPLLLWRLDIVREVTCEPQSMQVAHTLFGEYSPATQKGTRMGAPRKRASTAAGSHTVSAAFLRKLEEATRGLFALNVSVLERMEKRIGLAPLRALQSLERLGPSLVTELGDDLALLSSTASRLSDRLAEAGYITRRVSPTNRRATLLELTDTGRAVLDELVALRLHDFGQVARQMSEADRAALVRGAQSFTDAHHKLSNRVRHQPTRSDAAGNR